VSGAAAQGFAVGEVIALRPGVALPDWSLVPDPVGRAALAASMAVAGRRAKWAGLDPAEDALWRAVLRGLAGSGPLPAAGAARLEGLRRRDLLVLGAGGEVAAAYPFSARETPHRVTLAATGREVFALCAIDSLGAGAMLGTDSVVASRCAECGAGIRIATADRGRRLAAVEPRGAAVWSGTRYGGGCAATSGCALKPFFCCGVHLEAWRARTDPGGPGFRLSVAVALQAGLALFVPMLDPGPAPAPVHARTEGEPHAA
jgi:hypothetical protein